MLVFKKYINLLIALIFQSFSCQVLLLLLLTAATLQTQAQPPCAIQFSQCPNDTSLLDCNSSGDLMLSAYPPVSAYVTGACPVGSTLKVIQTAGPTPPVSLPYGTYLIQYTAYIELNGQPTGTVNNCSYHLTILPDNQPPVFTYCPPSITVNGTLDNNGNCKATGQWPVPIFTDNCGPWPNGMEVNIPCGSMLGAGTHTITYTAYDSGGSNSATCSFTVTVQCASGTGDPDVQPTTLGVFPNPTGGIFTVELPEQAAEGMLLRLVDPAGRMVLEQTTAAGYNLQTIDGAGLATGIYLVQLRYEGRVWGVGKLVRE